MHFIKTRYALQYNKSNNSQSLGLSATAHNPSDPHSFLFICLRGGGFPGAGTYVALSLNYAGCAITTNGVFSFSILFWIQYSAACLSQLMGQILAGRTSQQLTSQDG